MKKIILSLLLIQVIFFSCTQNSNTTVVQKTPKYVFLFIGDGMGANQAYIANEYLKQTKGDSLSFMYLPTQGYCNTKIKNRLIAGSAAAGTSIATGEKTTANTLGMDGAHKDSLESVAEALHHKGIKTGIITSVTIDHATPAVFYAHEESRHDYFKIGSQLSRSGINYFAGGGYKDPYGEKEFGKKSERSLYDIDRELGYYLVHNKEALQTIPDSATKVHVYADGPFAYNMDKTQKDFTLSELLEKGLKVLDNETGFFIMLEGGKIDWACHRNDAACEIYEVIEMDKAVRTALDFYKQHPDETLILVTADHETGGMSLGFTGTGYDLHLEYLSYQKVSGEVFDGMVEEWIKTGINEKAMMDSVGKYFGLGNEIALENYDVERLSEAYKASIDYDPEKEAGKYEKETDIYENKIKYGGYIPISVTATKILAEKAGIGWTTFHHSGAEVPIRSIGPGNEKFTNAIDNTDIAKNLFILFGIPFPN